MVLFIFNTIKRLLQIYYFYRSSKYQLFPAEGVLVNILGIVFVFYCLLVVYMITKPEFKRRPKLEYETLLK